MNESGIWVLLKNAATTSESKQLAEWDFLSCDGQEKNFDLSPKLRCHWCESEEEENILLIQAANLWRKLILSLLVVEKKNIVIICGGDGIFEVDGDVQHLLTAFIWSRSLKTIFCFIISFHFLFLIKFSFSYFSLIGMSSICWHLLSAADRSKPFFYFI